MNIMLVNNKFKFLTNQNHASLKNFLHLSTSMKTKINRC